MSLPRLRNVLVLAAAAAAPTCAIAVGSGGAPSKSSASLEERTRHLDLVRRADYCATCHPEATAEHRMNTHGRAFSDEEVRLATARFSTAGCIDCHTPRPIFETGIGKNPIKRLHHLEEANDCLSCHARAGVDFSTFHGSAEECRAAFDPRVGTVEACASCHRNHGTPYQWENATYGKKGGNICMDCHMPEVERAVAVGGPVKKTRRHTFFASRSPSQLAMAYAYDVHLDGNEVVVTLENAGAGHNFPTELKQRAVESLVVIRDAAGREVARSRDVHRDPYKRPYGLVLPVNTQIPSGEKRVHRVPIPIAAGSVETTLFYKLYYPIEDAHPDLSRVLETRSFPFAGITPSTKPIETPPEIHAALPEAIPAEAASPANLADFAQPKIGKVSVDVPDGSNPADAEKLVALFQFPVLEANRRAQDALVKMGEPALPALVGALGSWDNKTWTQGQNVLVRMGPVAKASVLAALKNPDLYVRYHAREILPRFADNAGAEPALVDGLAMENPLDRTSSADALGRIGAKGAITKIRPLVDDLDFDVAAAAARALARLDDRESLPALKRTLARVRPTVETARDVAWAVCALGDPAGIPVLLDGLAYADDLVRESCFESYLDVTGRPFGYTPLSPFVERSAALAQLRAAWAAAPEGEWLRRPRSLGVKAPLRAEIAKLVLDAGGNDVYPSTPEATEKAVTRLLEIGAPAIPQIVDGLKWPAGFADKRAALLRVVSERPDVDALAACIEASRDPVFAVGLWAVRALEAIGDPHALAAVVAYEHRYESAVAAGREPSALGHPEDVRVALGRARLRLGDPEGARLMLRLLFSNERTARDAAEEILRAYDKSWHEKPGAPAVAADVRRALETLPESRTRWAEALRETWRGLVEKAETAADKADAPDEIRAALEGFDLAEEAVTRYSKIDESAFAVDFQRTAAGADGLAARLYDVPGLRAALPERRLLSPAERRGWGQSRSGLDVSFDGERLVLEAPEDGPGGTLSFGIGGAGGTATALEWWRDYELAFEIEIVRKGVRILDRYDPIWAIFHETSLTVDAPGRPRVLYAPVAAGGKYEITHSVLGGDVVHRQHRLDDGPADGEVNEFRESVGSYVRKGGFVFQLDPGARVVIRNLRARVLRLDSAEALGLVLSTPGR
ncbi:MAG TPA: HEAT repeat domain-containing protein [Planctomycetota bacterium]|nr:HEAT repeat domain-containing protein [Planctomycetota bacterium]